MKHYTIGLAGHIDHGKTTLTKALTNIDTDRLKEEKERNISIELGYAPLKLSEEMEVSLIDVPGHERFIRQMIAGVAGIDLVILVVAADEGVMPQTREHLDILQLLGIKRGLVVITKVDRIDEEMKEIVELDIRDSIEGTFLEEAPLHFVNSITKQGIKELKAKLKQELLNVPNRDDSGAFRLPIDQVFTVHGQGTIVRGTVYEGYVHEGDMLELYPQQIPVRVRQLQVHRQERKQGRAGQRVAINLGGVSREELKRGNVLIASGHYDKTNVIDVSLKTVKDLRYVLKQRGAVKVHIATAEVYGKIVFFDRNELAEGDVEIVCQLRLDEPIVAKKGDRFIIRRPTPPETIGGGFIIDPHGQKYRFGQETVERLQQKKQRTPKEQLLERLKQDKLLSLIEACKELHISEEEFKRDLPTLDQICMLPSGEITSQTVINSLKSLFAAELIRYHNEFPLRLGMNKAEFIQLFVSNYPKKLVTWLVEEGMKQNDYKGNGPYIALASFEPHPPDQWKKRVDHVLQALEKENVKVTPLQHHMELQQIPSELYSDISQYFIYHELVFQLDEKLFIHKKPFKQAVSRLFKQTGHPFTLQDAKEILDLSRKYLVPFVEKLDQLGLTNRHDMEREWRVEKVENWLDSTS